MTLGGLRLFEPGRRLPLLQGVKPLLIPAVLATTRHHAEDRGYLARLVWPGPDPGRSHASLRTAIHHLKKYGQGAGLEVDEESVRLDPGRIEVDLWALQECVRESDHAGVLELYQGPFCSGVQDKGGTELAGLIESQNDRIHVAVHAAYVALIDEALAAGAVSRAVGLAQQFAGENPLSDRAQMSLIRALRSAGDPLGALQVYEGFRSLLRSELGGRPDAEMEAGLERLREEALGVPERTRLVVVPESRGEDASATSGAEGGAEPSRHWLVLLSVVALAASIWAVAKADAPSEASAPPHEVRVGITWAGGGGDLVWSGEEVGIDSSRVRHPGWSFSPDGRHIAVDVPSASGYDLGLVSRDRGDTILLTSQPMDEVPHQFSPDGRRLLYHQGVLVSAAEYQLRWRVIELVTREITDLGAVAPPGILAASWSPSGTRLALTDVSTGDTTVAIILPDGTPISSIGPDTGAASSPAWSPDGRRIAIVQRRGDAVEIRISTTDGSGEFTIVGPTSDLRTPVWLDMEHLAYLTGPSLVVLRLSDRVEVARIASPEGARLHPDRHPQSGWLDSLLLTPTPPAVSPGLRLPLEASLLDSDGDRPSLGSHLVRWTTSDSAVARIDQAGLMDVVGPGRATVSAELPGWRTTRAEVTSGPLAVDSALPVIFEEDWTDGLDADRWTPFGTPAPAVHAGVPPGPSYLVSNGDAHFRSGVTSVRGLAIGEGLTLEVQGQAPFQGVHYQDLVFGLTTLARDRSGAPTADGPTVRLTGRLGTLGLIGDRRADLPMTWDPSLWHTYTLQVSPDGWLAAFVDARLVRMETDSTIVPDRPWHLWLGGSSVGVEVKHGPLRVYRGLRYEVVDGPG